MKNSRGLSWRTRLDTDSLKMLRHQAEERRLWHRESKNRSTDKSRFGHPTLEWVLTIVNKADLWWDKRADVDKFYRNTYQPALLKVLKKYHMTHGAMPIRKYFSSRIQRFLSNVYPSSTFDDDDRWRLNDGLKETMAEALSNSKLG